ncbi:MAG: DUF169 domain-containing protein [Acidobacteriia bacterium]|nr:DUF169 domain-containing protein [Terriglobia bacterium]
MTRYSSLESRLKQTLGLSRRPVAVMSTQQPPVDMTKFSGSVPAGCSFWRMAADGRAFYAAAGDHYNCAIGCYTHNIPLPPEREAELGATVQFMTSIGYIRPEDVPMIARLTASPSYMAYAPLGDATFAPEVVILVGKPGKLMLLQEAAARAGVKTQPSLFARPTCMAIPAALSGGIAASSGCVGNRVYTDLDDDELYVMVPGADLEKIASELDTIIEANRQLNDYHRQRKAELLR